MKLLKQQFMQFCKDLGIKNAEYYFNDESEQALESVLIDGAKSGFRSEMDIDLITKKLILDDPKLDMLVAKYNQYELQYENYEDEVSFAKREEYKGKIKSYLLAAYPHIQAQQDEYAKEYVRAVEIQSAILLDRMRIMAGPKQTQQNIQTSISSSDVNRSRQNLGYLEQIYAEMKSINEAKHVDTLVDLDALMIKSKPQMEEDRQSIIQTLHEISNLVKNNEQAILEAFDGLHNVIAFMLFHEDAISTQYKEQNKDTYMSDLPALVEDASQCMRMYENEDISGSDMLNVIRILRDDLLLFGIPQDLINQRGMDQIDGLIKQVEQNRAEISKFASHPGMKEASELFIRIQREDLNIDLLQQLQTFYSTYTLPLDPVKSAFENLKDLEKQDAIHRIMTFLNVESLGTLIKAGPEGIQKLIQQREHEFRTKGYAQISVDDFVLRGDRDHFISLLVPTVVYLAACNVDDTVFSLSDFSHVLHLNLFEMVAMQKQVAKLLQFDFMAHHEEYEKYLTQWAKAHNVLEPKVLKAWDKEVLPELIGALNARQKENESPKNIKEKQVIKPVDPFADFEDLPTDVQTTPEPGLKEKITNFVSGKFLTILNVMPHVVSEKARSAILYMSDMQTKTKITEAAIESKQERILKEKQKSNSPAHKTTSQVPITPTSPRTRPKGPDS